MTILGMLVQPPIARQVAYGGELPLYYGSCLRVRGVLTARGAPELVHAPMITSDTHAHRGPLVIGVVIHTNGANEPIYGANAMSVAGWILTRRQLPLIVASAGLLVALLTAPLTRSLPGQWSFAAFYLLLPLQIGLGIRGLLLSPAMWERTRDRRALGAFLLSIAIFVVMAINFTTPWLWPYPKP